MADIEYTDAVAGADSAPGGGLGKLINIAGALASLALVVGIGVWGYKLWVRDVSGVPVVRAIEGPMRVAPSDPGGELAVNQGLAVNAVAARGTAAPVADELRLAPRPASLSAEDQPMGGSATAEAADVEAVAGQTTSETVDALVQKLIGEASPLESRTEVVATGIVQPEPLDAPASETALEGPAVDIVTGPGVARSLRPKARPANFASLLEEDLEEGDTLRYTGKVREADPESVPAGTRLAQLGAFESAEVARGEWDKLNLRFGDYLGDKTRVVQMATSGGRTFYRLRAMGFEDIADARRFCAVLAAENADCIPVTTR